MALNADSTVIDAIAQYKANLRWRGNTATADNLLEAVLFLMGCRADELADQGSSMKFESLNSIKESLEKFLGATAPRANGRSRVLTSRNPDTRGFS